MYKMSIYFYFYEDEILYIGSTFDLKQREKRHKSCLKCGDTMPFYKYLREQNLIFDNLRIEIVETAIYEKEPLKILEDMMIEYWKPKCNVYRAYLSEEDKKEQRKQYCENNKEKIKEYEKKRNKEEKKKYYNEYKEKNREEINRKQREYNEKNKDEYNRKARERYAKKKLEKLATIEAKKEASSASPKPFFTQNVSTSLSIHFPKN